MKNKDKFLSSLAWASEISGIKWTRVDEPKALAGQNNVFILSSESGEQAVLRVSPAHQKWARSGEWIKEKLLKAGHVVPKEMAFKYFVEESEWASLQSVVPGEDLAICWAGLKESEAASVAKDVGFLVSDSLTLFSDLKPDGSYGRFAPPNGKKSNESKDWPHFCQEWLDWAASGAMGAGNVSIEEIDVAREALARAWGLLSHARIQAFVWDVGDRNVMVKDGKFVGLVDQDELMMGDPWVAPGLALAQLTKHGVPWARKYALGWVQSWGGGANDVTKMSLYAALWAIQIAAKKGKVLPDGRVESGIPVGMIKKLCMGR